MFKVLQDNKDCTSKTYGWQEGLGWDNCEFTTFQQALEYAKAWLGDYAEGYVDYEDWDGKPYDFSGCGNKIEIREV